MIFMLLLIAAVVFCVFLFFKLIRKPLKWIFKFLLNALLGFVILILVDYLGGFIGFTLDITLINCFITGLLGVPGVLILIVLKLLF